MIFYGRVEIDEYFESPRFSANQGFMAIQLGWYSYTFILSKGEIPSHALRDEALKQIDAIRALGA